MSDELVKRPRFLYWPPDCDGEAHLEDRDCTSIACFELATLTSKIALRGQKILDIAQRSAGEPSEDAAFKTKEDINFRLMRVQEALKSVVESIGRNSLYIPPTHAMLLIRDLSSELQAHLLAMCLCDAGIVECSEEGDQQ
ncbi:hypothetical protein A0U92_03485 [Acetobacter aceti]|uniref:Uncharacterized protein n=1 Tax=Acetobacter aceti TaxID=435 RepID=A0A1U9KDU7_ACEAC|nr:hypothetical protein [Acetobacter aceti]AQS83983.1 hypothetical protein A0U92_03485 [Acetobacter aceti]